MADRFDAIVIGAGPNGLVAANLLIDAGWSVLLLEEQETPGGAVRSSELIEPGFVNDWFSAFYPLAAHSPAIGSLGLEAHGLEWMRSDVAVAHPALDGSVALIAGDPQRTAANFESFARGDGESWLRIYEQWERMGPGVLGALFSLFPPMRPAARIARAANGPGELLELFRLAVSGAREQGEQWFGGDGGRRMLYGNALHADLSPDEPPSAAYGWSLMCLAQQVGYPVPRGGAGKLSEAMASRFTAGGGRLVCGARATRIRTQRGRAHAVDFDGGEAIADRAILADVDAPQLYAELLDSADVPAAVTRALEKFEFDDATIKLDWTLDGPIPWAAEETRAAGTVHIAHGADAMTRRAAAMAQRIVPADPYFVLGQYDVLDPTRAPEGKSTAWAYAHVPQGATGDELGELACDWGESDERIVVERFESEIEKLAPGFRDLVRGRHVALPPGFKARDRNLVGGAVNGGTSRIRQQLILRPIPGLARPETAVKALYLASASAHPGGGVHGAPGANAARAAIAAERVISGSRVLGAAGRAIQRRSL